MSFFSKLMLNSQFEIVEVEGEVMAVSVGSDGNNYSGVVLLQNEATRFMFEKLQEGITQPELIKACMDKYTDSTVDDVFPKVMTFLNGLKEQNLLAVDTQHGMRVED